MGVDSQEGEKASNGNSIEMGIHFPALRVGQNLVQSIDSLDRINEWSNLALKKGFYKGLSLIDSVGHEFQIIGARKIRMLSPKPAFGSILGYLTGNPHFQVELIFAPGPPVRLSLEQVKQIIFDSFRKEKYSWEAMIDFDEFRGKVSAATSTKEILAIFQDFHV